MRPSEMHRRSGSSIVVFGDNNKSYILYKPGDHVDVNVIDPRNHNYIKRGLIVVENITEASINILPPKFDVAVRGESPIPTTASPQVKISEKVLEPAVTINSSEPPKSEIPKSSKKSLFRKK